MAEYIYVERRMQETNTEFSRRKRRERGRNRNNPDGEPTGHYTGRCRECGSKDLWDDNLHYGCNDCGAMLA